MTGSSRITWLIVAALALMGLRWWTWPASEPAAAASDVVSPALPAEARASNAQRRTTGAAPMAPSQDLAAGLREPETAAPRNAFAIRQPPAPPAPPAVRQVVPPAPKPFVGPPVFVPDPPAPPPPPPPPPPYQVIGSWHDERGPSVFLAGPRGVVQGRVGDALGGDYRISAITPQQVVLKHLTDPRDATIPVPATAHSTLTPAK